MLVTRRSPLVVETPDDAWRILGAISQRELDAEASYSLEFRGWALELMRLPLAERSSISISLMRDLIEYQSHINRSYKILKYDRPTGRLYRQEKEEIELNIVVLENGSVYKTDVRKALGNFAAAAAQKMEARHLTIFGIAVVLIIATGYFGSDVFKTYVAAQAASRDLATHTDEITKLSEQETARAKILGALASDNAEARRALVQVESAYQPLLRGAAAAGDAQVLGTNVPADIARELTRNPRRTGEGTRIDGRYEVADIERHEIGVFSVLLRAPNSDNPIIADARSMFIPDDQIDLLLNSLKTGRYLNIMVNAWRRADRVVSAEIVRVDPETK